MKQLLSTNAGVKINLLHPVLSQQLYRLAHLWVAIFPLDEDGLTITSGYEGFSGDGVHMKDSLHYKRCAVDLRVRDVDIVMAEHLFCDIARKILGPDYDIVFEGNHIHIELDPKETAHAEIPPAA